MTSVFAKQPPTPEEMYQARSDGKKEFDKQEKNAWNNKNETDNNKQQKQHSSRFESRSQSSKNRHHSNSQQQVDQKKRQSTSSTRHDEQQNDTIHQRSRSRDPNNNPNFKNEFVNNALRFVPGAPTKDLPPIETKIDPNSRKFLGRCRLFVGNLPHNIAEDKVRELFKPFGEVGEVFLGPKCAFAFIKLDYRKNAEAARDKLDGQIYEGRTLRIRLSAHPAAIRVKNLSPQVTNELLAYAFRYFGEIERAVVVTDDKGKSIGEGLVEFAKKSSATFALKRCQQDNFILTATPMPVLVEPDDQNDDEEGLTEKSMAKHTAEFAKEREIGPRFAEQGSFEDSFASRWKQLFAYEKQRRDKLEEELREARTALHNQIECSRLEHESAQLRDKLKQMEEDQLRLQSYNNEVNFKQPIFNPYANQPAPMAQASMTATRPVQDQDVAFNTNDSNDQSNTSTPAQNESAIPLNNGPSGQTVTSQPRSYAEAAALMNVNQQQYLQTLAAPQMMQPMYGAAYQTHIAVQQQQQQQQMQQHMQQQQQHQNLMMAQPMTSGYQPMKNSKKHGNNQLYESDNFNSGGRARKRGRY